MCGIYGMVSITGAPLRYPEALEHMGRAVRHRGPDHTGTMVLPHAAIGVNRLRIVDLDPRADQPLVDETHCLSLAANGEIYNSPELRRAFPAYRFRSKSDLEVLIPLYLRQGPASFAELNGMFAVALWDEGGRRLVLARDRAGEKPLFYSVRDGEVWFASEIQTLLQHPAMDRTLDHAALEDFVALGYVREPRTMFTSIQKVGAGTSIVFGNDGTSTDAWGADEPEQGAERPLTDSAHLAPELGGLLERAVRRQLTADVPVGVFLSGGLDSALLAAIAAREVPAPLKTFSVRFTEPSYDEGAAARATSAWIGTHHSEVTATPDALGDAFHALASNVAEPIADPAILPTYLLARDAKNQVGVVLSGEGADELFGGYPTYLGHRLAPLAARIPLGLRQWMATMLPRSAGSVPLAYLLERFLHHAHRPWQERHLAWFGTGLGDYDVLAHPRDADAARTGAVRQARLPTNDLRLPPYNRESTDVLRNVLRLDYRTYLRDGLLPKIDRATMQVALEARAPYLDRDVTRFAFALPTRFKVRGLSTKWLLRRAARRRLPPDIIDRRKHGLSVPISRLINGELRAETDRLLSPGRLRRQGLFNASATGQLLSSHRAGNFSVARGVWALVVLQRWLEVWG